MTTVTSQEPATPNPPSFTRLHITPLDSELLNVVLSTSIRPRARNISFHTLSTFPEKRYGFLELPVEDADKIKQKLNGAVLKGVKIRIEPARPERTPGPLGDAAMAGEKEPRREKKPKDKSESKKRKRDREEVPGAVLEPGRKIKRGWTTTQDEPKPRKDKRDKSDKDKDKKRAKKEVKSKYTTHAECLIKTSVPNAPEDNEADGEKKRKKSRSKEAVIHEFEKTTKFPTFLKTADSSSSKKKNLEFVDGKGWVDEDGTVVEAVKSRPATAARATPPSAKAKVKLQHDEHDHSSSGDDATSDGSEGELEVGSDSELGSDDEPAKADSPSNRVKSNAAMSPPTLSSILKSEPARPQSSSSAKSLTIKIPPATPKVHPLEALYKRPKQPNGTPTQVTTSEPEPEPFSFFGNAGSGSDEDDNEDNDDTAPTLQIPMTPFTRQDFESRGVRSAAPTPDTAHINRTFKLWPRGGTEDIDEESEEEPKVEQEPLDDEDRRATSADRSNEGQEAQPAAGFQDWFWENRGDLNRSWKKRRKTVAKDKRYRENQARADRAI